MSFRRQVAEILGYKVFKRLYGYSLIDPGGAFLSDLQTSEEDAWSFVPPLDTWEGVGLTLKWLISKDVKFGLRTNSFGDAVIIRDERGYDTANVTIDEFPKAICEFALQVAKE